MPSARAIQPFDVLNTNLATNKNDIKFIEGMYDSYFLLYYFYCVSLAGSRSTLDSQEKRNETEKVQSSAEKRKGVLISFSEVFLSGIPLSARTKRHVFGLLHPR